MEHQRKNITLPFSNIAVFPFGRASEPQLPRAEVALPSFVGARASRPREAALHSPAARSTFHRRPQEPVDSRLVTTPVGLEPGEHLGVETNGERLLDRPIELAHDRPSPISHFGSL